MTSDQDLDEPTNITIRVYHAYYGCDSGCCGHIIEFKRGDEEHSKFEFVHPYGQDEKEFAKELAMDYLKKYHPECIDTINWESLQVEVLDD